MRHSLVSSAFVAASYLGHLAAAANTIDYVTDLPIYSSLAQCVQTPLSYYIQTKTLGNCPDDASGLQSCVCSNTAVSSSVFLQVSSGVSISCGESATAAQSSASVVFGAYCTQDGVAASFTGPATPVSVYITDIPEKSYLASCAYNGITDIIMTMTYSLCPSAASDLATCVCQTDQYAGLVSSSISSYVKSYCSSHAADVSSAEAFYEAYCNLNSGISSFPTPSNPPGDMTYYITDMPQYSSLPSCVRDAVSDAVFTNTQYLCPEGPEMLASCICIKSSMPALVTSYVSSNIKSAYCSTFNTAQISSAINVLDQYCSAAKGELVATGIAVSKSQSQHGGGSGTHGSVSPETGSPTGSTSSGSSGSSGTGSSKSSSHTNTGVIAGAVVGGVVAVVAVVAASVFVCLRVRKNKRQQLPSHDGQLLDNLSPQHGAYGKAELSGVEMGPAAAAAAAAAGMGKPPPSPSQSSYQHGEHQPSPVSPSAYAVSPGSAVPPGTSELQGHLYAPNQAYGPPLPHGAELPGQHAYGNGMMAANTPELPSQHAYGAAAAAAAAASHAAELEGQAHHTSELEGQAEPYSPLQAQHPQGQPIYPADSRPVQRPAPSASASASAGAAAGMAWHSGPVPQTYAELDQQNNGGHARVP